jgi:hypothetical protein
MEGKNIDDDSLLKLSVKDLNKLLKSLSQEDRLTVKRRRRILKNRGYAANCRTKRLSQKEILQIEKEKLEREVNKLSSDNQMLSIQLDSFKQRLSDLQAYSKILKPKLTLPMQPGNSANTLKNSIKHSNNNNTNFS